MSTGSSQKAQLQFLNQAGVDVIQLIGQGGNVLMNITANGGFQVVPQPITANGAINPFVGATYVITKAGIAALTLAAPVAGLDDGNEINLMSTTAFAHSVTATGLLQTGTAFVNSVTFPAQAGAAATFTAYNGKWIVSVGGANGAAYAQTYVLA